MPSAAAARQGELRGLVQDDQGRPIAGRVVSAVGSTSVFAVSGEDGRFTFRSLPAGPYLVRAHLQNYLPARGRLVQVSCRSRSVDHDRAGSSVRYHQSTPSVVAASVAPEDTSVQPTEAQHGHDEVAWRLRHLKRSVLKDAGQSIAEADAETSLFGDSLSGLGRAVGHSARLAILVVRRSVAQRAVQSDDDDVVRPAAGPVLDERRRAAKHRLRRAGSAGRERRLDDARQHHPG